MADQDTEEVTRFLPVSLVNSPQSAHLIQLRPSLIEPRIGDKYPPNFATVIRIFASDSLKEKKNSNHRIYPSLH